MLVIIIRTVLIYVFLIAAMRVMGKRQLGELQPTELVVTLLIADLVVIPMQEVGIPLVYGLIPVIILVSLELLSSALMLKMPFVARLFSGTPVVVVQNGCVNEQALVKLRLTIEDLSDAMRALQVYDMQEIETATVETNGKISIILKPSSRPLTAATQNLPIKEDTTLYLVIHDGERCRWTYPLCEIDDSDIDEALKEHGFSQDEVLMMTCNRRKEFQIYSKGELL